MFAVPYKCAHDGNLAAAQPRKTINPLSLYRIKKQQTTRSQTQWVAHFCFQEIIHFNPFTVLAMFPEKCSENKGAYRLIKYCFFRKYFTQLFQNDKALIRQVAYKKNPQNGNRHNRGQEQRLQEALPFSKGRPGAGASAPG